MEEPRFLSVTGTGTSTCQPDIGLVYLYVQGRADSLKGAARNCNQVLDRVVQVVRSSFREIIWISHVDSFAGQPAGHAFPETPQVAPGMVHVKKLFVTLPANPETAQRVADVALAAGAVISPTVEYEWPRHAHSTILYTHSDYDSIYRQALEAAVAVARDNAVHAGKTIGKRCGDAVSLMTELVHDGLHPRRWSDECSMPFLWSRMTESSSTLRVTVTVRVRFEFDENAS